MSILEFLSIMSLSDQNAVQVHIENLLERQVSESFENGI